VSKENMAGRWMLENQTLFIPSDVDVVMSPLPPNKGKETFSAHFNFK